MPSVLIKTNMPNLEDSQTTSLMNEISSTVSKLTGKPENFVLVSFESCKMIFAGSSDPCAYVFLASLGGIGPSNNPAIVQGISAVLGNVGIAANRIYVQFSDVKERSDFGWNNTTFG